MNTKEINVITDHNPTRFCEMVNEKLKSGWFIIQSFVGPDADKDCPQLIYSVVVGRSEPFS